MDGKINDVLGGRGILSIAPNELSAPIELLMELTWKCNLKCVHCMMNAEYCPENEPEDGELTTEEIKGIIDRACELGVAHIDFSGGEPLLRKDIFEILEYSSKKGVEPCLLSNGTLITEEVAKKLKEVGVYKIELNLDGHTAELYDSFRGVKGAFDKTITAIKAVQKAGIPLRVNSMLCKPLYPYFEDIIEYAGQLGIVELCFVPLRIAGQTVENYDKLAYTPLEYAEMLLRITDIKIKMQEKYKMVILFLGDTDIGNYINPNSMFPSCGAGRLHCTIGADGSVRPCPAFPQEEEFIAGNIRERDIADIWQNAEIFKKLRNPNISGCDTCENKSCVGGCRVQSLWKYGDVMQGPEPYCEKVITKEMKKTLLG